MIDHLAGTRSYHLNIADVLNQTHFFSKRDKLIEYGKEFYAILVLKLKIMNFPFFAHLEFYFQHHFHFQGLEHDDFLQQVHHVVRSNNFSLRTDINPTRNS